MTALRLPGMTGCGIKPVQGADVLSVVATPIGNLEDVTLRALRTLRECDAVVAEDTRRTRGLLTHHGISGKEVLSLPAFDEARRLPALLARLDAGEHLALVSDGGTPVLSDPGSALVKAAHNAGHTVTPVPGPSAPVAALSATGMGTDGFCFLGFLPRSPSKLTRTVAEALECGRTLVFFEAPQRLARTLRLLASLLGEREVVVARELTKLHETFHRGTAAVLAEEFSAHAARGECTVLVEP